MFDWLSALIGALFSLAVALFSYHYQHWKSDVHQHISLLYLTRSRILLNKSLLLCALAYPDKRDILMEKIQLLPAYPFTDLSIIDQFLREEQEIYNTSLVLTMAGDQEYKVFSETSRRTLRISEGLLQLWTSDLQHHLLLYFILPVLLKKQNEKMMQNYEDQSRC